MSEENSDTDSSCEWTFILEDGKSIEDVARDDQNEVPRLQVPAEGKMLDSSSASDLNHLTERSDDAKNSQLDETSRSDSSSDIEKIEEPFGFMESGDCNSLWNKDAVTLEKPESRLMDEVLGRSLLKCVSKNSSDNEHFWNNSAVTESSVSKDSECAQNDFNQAINRIEDLTENGGLTHSGSSSSMATDINNLMDNLLSDCCKHDGLSSLSDEGSSIELINQVEDALPLVADDFSDQSSTISNQDVPADLNVNSLRIYRHTPNQRLNFMLNTLVLLVVAAVIGLGIGHFIGWSGRWLRQQQVQHSYVTKMKTLQMDITTCLQQTLSSAEEGKIQPCFENWENWKQQLQELIYNDKDLQAALTNKEHHSSASDDSSFQTLQLDFLHKQLEYIEAIKEFEQKQTEEKIAFQKVKDLEEENSDLKIKLEKEEEGEAEDQKIMFMLMKENAKLKLTIDELQEKVQDDESQILEHSKLEMGTLREQINQLKIENEDLRSMIARMRYAPPPSTDLPVDVQNSINKLKTENLDLKVEIGKLRYTKANIDEEKIKNPSQKDTAGSHESSSKQSSSFAWIEKELYGILHGGHEVAKKILNKTVTEYKKLKNNEALWNKINNKVSGVFDFLNSKWERIQNSVSSCQSAEPSDSFANIHEQTPPDAEQDSMNARKYVISNFMNLFTLFKKTCKDIKNRVSEFSPGHEKEQHSRKATEDDVLTTDEEMDHIMNPSNTLKFQSMDDKFEPNFNPQKSEYECFGEECVKLDKSNADTEWLFQRAWYRENKKLQAKAAEWLFDRARDREEQRRSLYTLKSDPLHSTEALKNQETPTINVNDMDEKHLKGDWYFKSKLNHEYDTVHELDDDDDDDDDFDDDLYDDDDNDDDYDNHFYIKTESKYPDKGHWHPRTKYGYASQSEFSDHKFHSKRNKKMKTKHCKNSKNKKHLDIDCFKYS